MERMTRRIAPVALITGASRGFGRAVAVALSQLGWRVVLDARSDRDLTEASAGLRHAVAISGSVTDPVHRRAVAAAVDVFGGLDLLVNNASYLGPSPRPPLADFPLSELRTVYETNVIAPLALVQEVLPLLRARGGTIVAVSSDAAVQPYQGWGGYGSSKSALDQLSAVLAVEEPNLHVYAFDPGDMRTEMHQAAFPGEDISDRPEPETVVPALLRLVAERPASGRYRAADLAAARADGAAAVAGARL
jgi:NAD(P)-dependent dehydrogenase (short-subunit alcohol dehydrogenase family)